MVVMVVQTPVLAIEWVLAGRINGVNNTELQLQKLTTSIPMRIVDLRKGKRPEDKLGSFDGYASTPRFRWKTDPIDILQSLDMPFNLFSLAKTAKCRSNAKRACKPASSDFHMWL
jgi:hypothetical protein